MIYVFRSAHTAYRHIDLIWKMDFSFFFFSFNFECIDCMNFDTDYYYYLVKNYRYRTAILDILFAKIPK